LTACSSTEIIVPEAGPEDEASGKPTAVGCVLTLLSVGIIFASALPIVRWRDPVTGEALPREVAILSPVLIGAAFYGITSFVLRLIGLPVWSKQEKEVADDSEA
jgi:hypothetical protein